jgi:hypothetical protein
MRQHGLLCVVQFVEQDELLGKLSFGYSFAAKR